jgi:hypothetical protein
MSSKRKLRLGELLVAAGVLDETHLNAALAEQRKWGGELGRVLVDMKIVSEEIMVKALSRQLGLACIDLDRQRLPGSVTKILPVDLCERYGIFPVGMQQERRVVQVATSDPTNYEALDEVAFRTNMKVEPVVATPSGIDRAIRRYYYGETPEAQQASKTLDPEAYGLRNQGRMVDLGPDARAGEARAPAAAPVADGDRLSSLEQTLAAEVRALRGLVELLVEQGIIRREDYLKKVRRS